ncbi:Rho GTPase [Rhodotorula kratochvilovae]
MPALCGLPLPSTSPHGVGVNGADGHGGYAGSSHARPLGRKVVVVGDGACGKTSLLNVYVKGEFPQEYEPTVFENHCVDLVVDGRPVELSLWDTAGQEDFDRLRSLSYPDTNVVMMCFSVDQPTSLENLEAKWIDEIRHYCPGVKIAVVALKCDLRADTVVCEKLAQHMMRPVQYEEGLEVAKRIGASRYFETSAKLHRGVQQAFEEAARVSISAPRAGETRGSPPAADARGASAGCTVS